MWPFAALTFLVLAVLSLRGLRWAYVAFVTLGLLFFPARVGFHFRPQSCEMALDVPLALFSLTNWAHIVLFALFFVMTSIQLRASAGARAAWAAAATLVMGVLVELAEALTGKGHCRLRDLVPDVAGIVVGAVLVFTWQLWRGSVRLRR